MDSEEPAKKPKFTVIRLSGESEFIKFNETIRDWGRTEKFITVGYNDVPLFGLLDPNGWFVGKLDDEIISVICAINYNDKYSFIGFFTTKSEYRSQGYGVHLLTAALEHCGSRNVGLYSVPHMVSRYEREGFKSHGQTQNYMVENPKDFLNQNNPFILDANDVSFESICDLDRKYFPAERQKFLKAWITQKACTALAYVKDGKTIGYGVIRKCYGDKYCKLGPLFADEFEAAEALAIALLSKVHDAERVRIETLTINALAEALATKLGWESSSSGMVMYRDGSPKFDNNGIYAFTSGVIG